MKAGKRQDRTRLPLCGNGCWSFCQNDLEWILQIYSLLMAYPNLVELGHVASPETCRGYAEPVRRSMDWAVGKELKADITRLWSKNVQRVQRPTTLNVKSHSQRMSYFFRMYSVSYISLIIDAQNQKLSCQTDPFAWFPAMPGRSRSWLCSAQGLAETFASSSFGWPRKRSHFRGGASSSLFVCCQRWGEH